MTRPPIWLAPDEPMCRPSACNWPKPCARKEVAYTPGRSVGDFSLRPAYGYAVCGAPKWAMWVSVADAVKPVAEQQAKEWIGS